MCAKLMSPLKGDEGGWQKVPRLFAAASLSLAAAKRASDRRLCLSAPQKKTRKKGRRDERREKRDERRETRDEKRSEASLRSSDPDPPLQIRASVCSLTPAAHSALLSAG